MTARWWRLAAGSLVVLLMSACATPVPRPPVDESIFDDKLFGRPSERIDTSELFTLTPAMRRFLEERILPGARIRGPHEALIEALYARDMLRLEYDADYTRNAHEAFEARMGNCLSLVIMTAAFAREMGLQVRFQDVPRVNTWDRNGDLYFLVGHVNLMLGPSPRAGWTTTDARWLIIDFLPGQDLIRQRARAIDEDRIRAMYMNNRAAEAMSRGRLDDAYWWVRGAYEQDKGHTNTLNTLGVIYRRQGSLAAAERAFRQAIAIEPENAHAISNLAGTLVADGRQAEAAAVYEQLKALRATMPYELFNQGMQALRDGDYVKAKSLFERELDNVADNHEFHFWLAVTHQKLGDTRRARRHLQLALENSSTRAQAAAYTAKLEKLKASATN